MKTRQIIVFAGITFGVCLLIAALAWKQNVDIAHIKDAYVSEQNAEIDRNVAKIEDTFNAFYQGIRTMSLLPGVRSIDRYAKTFNPDSKAAMQQIYNNTFLNVTLSEVYILPKTLNPDAYDPITKKNEEPILTFDEFIVSKTESNAASTMDEKKEIEEVEIFEYRLMKTQLAYLAERYPTNSEIKGLAVPAITGEEVITCDNSEFTPKDLEDHNDAPRNGVVLTVPRYDLQGQFAGGVSGVVRTNVLKKLFPTSFYGLVNRAHKWQVIESPSQDWNDSVEYFKNGVNNPNLIISQVRKLKIVDSAPWELWVAKSDADFYVRNDVKQANVIFYAGVTVSLLLGGLLLFGAWSAFTNQERLEQRVEEKTAALSERNGQMALILNNAEEGFLTVNLDGTMDIERSAIVETWFGVPSPQSKFWEYIALHSKSQSSIFRIGWDQLIEGVFPFDMCADQMPKTIVRDNQHLSLKFKAVNSPSGALHKVLLMITDITDLVEAGKRELQQRELVAIFQKFSADRTGFQQFVTDAKDIVHKICERSIKSDRDLDFREIHTLKGNSSQFGLFSVAQLCHKLETEISESSRTLTEEERLQLKAVWTEAFRTLKDFVGDSESKHVIVEFDEYDSVIQKMRTINGAEMLLDRLRSWSLESTAVPLRRLGEQVKSLSLRLSKGDVDVIIRDNGVRLDSDLLRDLWMNTTHLVRNTVDHGLESPEERLKLGKGRPKIIFESQMTSSDLTLKFSDDGRGIDWEKIKKIALKNKLPAATQSDLEQALFSDGVSTKDEVSETSGRGVGMSALMAAVKKLGGDITIVSHRGKGTTFSIRIPKKPPATSKVA